MKKLLFLVLAIATVSICYAQREVFPVSWDSVTVIVNHNPDSVASLVKRMSATTLDTSLTYEERRLAFYGQSLLTKDEEDIHSSDLSKLFKAAKYEESLSKAEEMLAINPLCLEALVSAEYSVLKMVKAGSNKWKMDDAAVYYNRAMRIYNTIATTGDGSAEHPFYVTKVADEYNFMRYYLDLWAYASQALVGMCDKFTLKEGSQYYDDSTIYFEASRPIQKLQAIFGM